MRSLKDALAAFVSFFLVACQVSVSPFGLDASDNPSDEDWKRDAAFDTGIPTQPLEDASLQNDALVSHEAASDANRPTEDEDADTSSAEPDAQIRRDASPDSHPIGTFRHPGVLLSKEQLDFVRAKLRANQEPWKSALEAASKSKWGSLSYRPRPYETVECGPYSNPDVGCTDEKADSAAAYTHALLWYYTENPAYAKKSIEIMNAWSQKLREHALRNSPLQCAWVASVFVRAAEIIRYTYSGWAKTDIDSFAHMLRDAYVPYIIKGRPYDAGNWELSISEALLGIGVFLEDRAILSTGLDIWRKRLRAYVYLRSDGARPAAPAYTTKYNTPSVLADYWHMKPVSHPTFLHGQCQETCRDMGHTQYGIAAATNAAETARIQGYKLFEEEQERITTFMEYTAQFMNGKDTRMPDCARIVDPRQMYRTWEIAYNAYANRLGVPLPETKLRLARSRPGGVDHHMVWETLTHAETGNLGVQAQDW